MLGCVNELHVGAGPLDNRVSPLRTKDNSDLFAAQIEHSISGVTQSPSLVLLMRCLLSSDAGLTYLSHGLVRRIDPFVCPPVLILRILVSRN